MAIQDENDGAYVQLQSMIDADYEVKDGEPDVTGWNVRSTEGPKIGEVDDLLFDPVSLKVRYLVVDTSDNELSLDDEHLLLIPIGVAQLHDDTDNVIIPQADTDKIKNLPAYDPDALTYDTEVQVRDVFDAGGSHTTAPYQHPQFYEHEHFNADRFYGRGTAKTDDAVIDDYDMDADDAGSGRVNPPMNDRNTPLSDDERSVL